MTRAIQTRQTRPKLIMMESLHSFHSIANYLIDTGSNAWVGEFDTPIGILDWLNSLLCNQDGANLDDITIQLLFDSSVPNVISFLWFAQDPFSVLLAYLSTADLHRIKNFFLCYIVHFSDDRRFPIISFLGDT